MRKITKGPGKGTETCVPIRPEVGGLPGQTTVYIARHDLATVFLCHKRGSVGRGQGYVRTKDTNTVFLSVTLGGRSTPLQRLLWEVAVTVMG